MSQALDRRQLRALVSVWLRRDMHLAGGKGAGLAGVLVMSSLFLLLGAMAAAAMVFAGVPRFPFATLGLLFGSMPTAMAVITDFGVAAVDISDQDVVGHRPVNDRTYLVARMCTVAFYAFVVGIPAQLPYALGGLIVPGSTNAFPLAYLLVACGVIAATVSGVVMTYASISRFFGPRRLANLVLGVQLFSISLFFIGGPMIGPTTALLARVDLARVPWFRYLPHAWAAAVVDVLLGKAEGPTVALAALGVAVLLGLVVVLPSRLSLGYVDALSRQLASAAGERPPAPARGRLAPLTQAGYGLALAALRDPQTRLRVMPGIVLPVVYACLTVLIQRSGDPLGKGDFLSTLSGLMPAGLLAVGPSGFLIATEFSNSWRAAWIFTAMPILNPGLVQRGVKLAALRSFLPGVLVYGVVCAFVWPLHHVLVILIDVLCASVMSTAVASLAVQAFPASRPMQAGTGIRAQVLTFLALLIPIAAFVAVWLVVGGSIVGHLVADLILLALALPIHLGVEALFDLAAGRGRPLLAVDPEGALADERVRRSLWALGAAALASLSVLVLAGTGYGLWRLSGRRGMEGLRASAATRAGMIALEGGEAVRAAELAEEALRRDGSDSDALRLQGKALLRLKRYDVALKVFEHQTAVSPDEEGGHYFLGEALLGLDRCADALPHFALEIEQPRELWLEESILGQARAQKRCGKPAEAEESYRHYLRRRPKDGKVAGELAKLLSENGRAGEAVELRRQAEEDEAP